MLNVQAGERERKIKLTKQTNKHTKERKKAAGRMSKCLIKLLIAFGSSFPVSLGASVYISHFLVTQSHRCDHYDEIA